jgi:hypothetical protein
MSMPTTAQQNSPKVDCEYHDHESHGTHRGNHHMMLPVAEAQPTHHETTILGYRGLYHAHY